MVKEKMFALMKKKGTNQIDDLTTGLVNNMRYSDNEVIYPRGGANKGDGVEAAWFYDAYNGSNGFSELDTIHQYIAQEAMFEDIGEMMMGIALVEMKHLDKLGDLIMDLGGSITQPTNNENVNYGKTAQEAVEISIKGETNAIKGYKEIMEKVEKLPQNETTIFVLNLLAKLIADEKFHIGLFKEWQSKNKIKK